MKYEVRCLKTGESAVFEYSLEDGGGYVVTDPQGRVTQTNFRSPDVIGDGFDTLRDARASASREMSGMPAIGRELVPNDGDHTGGGPVG